MQKRTIAVTGATGNVGRKVAERLLAAGAAVRVVGRDPGRLASLAAKGAQVAAVDVNDAAGLAAALRGADAAFVMLPPNLHAEDFRLSQARTGEAIAAAVRDAAVPRVVHLSSVGGHLPERTGPILAVHDQEQRLGALPGVAVVNLRPAYFMENHLWSVALIKAQGINGSSMRPDVAIPQIATADIAERAAERLLACAFEGVTVEELLGPADLTQAESTRVLGAAIGRPGLAYVQFPYEAAGQAMRAMGVSASAAEAMLEMNRSFNEGWIVPERPRGAASTTPTTLETFARTVFAPAFAAA